MGRRIFSLKLDFVFKVSGDNPADRVFIFLWDTAGTHIVDADFSNIEWLDLEVEGAGDRVLKIAIKLNGVDGGRAREIISSLSNKTGVKAYGVELEKFNASMEIEEVFRDGYSRNSMDDDDDDDLLYLLSEDSTGEPDDCENYCVIEEIRVRPSDTDDDEDI